VGAKSGNSATNAIVPVFREERRVFYHQ